jgi:hypothetical protein
MATSAMNAMRHMTKINPALASVKSIRMETP